MQFKTSSLAFLFVLGTLCVAVAHSPEQQSSSQPVPTNSGVPQESAGEVAATAQQPSPLTVSPEIAAGRLIKKVAPYYPAAAKARGVTGTVVLLAVVDKKGNVTHLQLLQGDPLLVTAAIDAVRQWKYQPYLLNGEPVEVQTTMKVMFALEGDGTITSSPQAGTPAAMGGKLPDQGTIVPGTIIKRVEPEYPATAKAEGTSGSVTLRVVVDRKGNVTSVQPIGGDPVFFDSAIKAVRQWKYTPFTVNGKAINVATQVTLTYKTSTVSERRMNRRQAHS